MLDRTKLLEIVIDFDPTDSLESANRKLEEVVNQEIDLLQEHADDLADFIKDIPSYGPSTVLELLSLLFLFGMSVRQGGDLQEALLKLEKYTNEKEFSAFLAYLISYNPSGEIDTTTMICTVTAGMRVGRAIDEIIALEGSL